MKKNTIFSIISLILLTLSTLSCEKDIQYNTEAEVKIDKVGIIINKNSSVRIQPYIYSSKVTSLKRGTKVDILSQSSEKSYIAGMKRYWYQIKMQNNIVGWTYGSNIKVFDKGKEKSIENYEIELRNSEIDKIKQDLEGKWWSINKRGDFTSHKLILYKDGKYKSGRKYGKLTEGEYTLDIVKQTITFSKGSTAGNKLFYIERGGEYNIEYHGKNDYKFQYKKISDKPDSEDEKIHTTE